MTSVSLAEVPHGAYSGCMPKRSRKPGRADLNELARRIVDRATGAEPPADDNSGKNPAAVALGRLGGKKGGPARAANLTAKQRHESAKKAAAARWRRD